MLSFTRDHEKSLPDSERFYFNNYEYYNSAEPLSDYENDLSKLRFNCERRSTTTIVLYDTHSSNYEYPSEKEAKPFDPQPTHHAHSILDTHKTLEDFFYHFAATYHEHNFSYLKHDPEDSQKHFQVCILDFYGHLLLQQFQKTEAEDHEALGKILAKLKDFGATMCSKLEALFEAEGRVETNEFLERWFAFEQYMSFSIQTNLEAESKNEKPQNFYLFEYCLYFRWLFRQICNGNMRSLLLSAVPFTPITNLLVHPLTIPLTFTCSELKTSPKIIFLNLDGRQTFFNVRALSVLPKQVKYISIFKQSEGIDLINTKLDNTCEQFEVDSNFVNMTLSHSELLFRQVQEQRSQEGDDDSERILLYPLNSLHLRRKYSKLMEDRPLKDRKMPKLGTSSDILWLWEQKIAAQVEDWHPEFIIVSYNGSLNIKQEDFDKILKDLSILSDHRVVLFPNLSAMHQRNEGFLEQIQEDDWSPSRIRLIDEFARKYQSYSYEKINEQTLFDNFSSFIKTTAGETSMRATSNPSPLGKYAISQRKKYLQCLQVTTREADQPFIPQRSVQFDRLFNKFADKERKDNRKENEAFQKLAQSVQKQFISLNASILQQTMDCQRKAEYEQISKKQIEYRLLSIMQQLEAEADIIHGQNADIEREMEEHIKKQKQQLQLEYLRHFRMRKTYVGEEDQRGRIRHFRFCLEDDEEVSLEQYSQVVVDQKKLKVFLINFKETEEIHSIMQGQISERSSLLKIHRVNKRIEKTFEDLNISNKQQQTLKVNYSYCFLKDKLYLYWPQQWNFKTEIKKKMLGLDYNPPHINHMLRVQYYMADRCYLFEQIKFKQPAGSLIPMVPRKGCTSIDCGEDRFYIFGGVYGDRLDYYEKVSSIGIAQIKNEIFTVSQLPKRKDRHLNNPNNIKPKMRYKIERSAKSLEEGTNSINLSLGYGRKFTNFHHLQSREHYNIMFQFQGVKINKNVSKNSRLVKLEKPIQRNWAGRFYVKVQEQSQEKYSDCLKDWMVAEGRAENNGDSDILSVLEQDIRIFDFKTDSRKQYLFGWDKTIREKIYLPHCWSPELQILNGYKLHIIYTALRTERNSHYNAGNYIIPKEEDLVSICLDEDRLWILASSPIVSPLDAKNNLFMLYQGSLGNINYLINRKQLLMVERFEFRQLPNPALLRFKTLFAQEQKIWLLGGITSASPTAQSYREDYILQKVKDKFRLKYRKVESDSCSLQLTHPFILRYKEMLLLYSVWAEERLIIKGSQGEQVVEEFWNIKIQTMQNNQTSTEETVIKGPLHVYQFDSQTESLVLRKISLKEPKFVKIVQYNKFSFPALKELIEKVYLRIIKCAPQKFQTQLSTLQQMLAVQSEQLNALVVQLHHRGPFFKKLLADIKSKVDEEKKEKQNFESEELVKDLRFLFNMLNKHLLETLLQPQASQTLYKFIIEDRNSRKVKYVGIGPILTSRIKFMRVRFKYELSTCLNEAAEEELFYNNNVAECEEMVHEKGRGASFEVDWEEETYSVRQTYK